MNVGGGDTVLDETSERAIVELPDVIGLQSDRSVWTRKGAKEPRSESLQQGQ